VRRQEADPAVSVSIILPTYNEGPVIVGVVREILDCVTGGEVLVVDDDSPDRTWDLVGAAFAGDPRVRVLRRIGRRGLPSALAEGIDATGGDAVAWLDADGSMPAAVIPRLRDALATADVAVASRYAPGGADARDSMVRVVASRAINGFASLTLGGPVRDWTSGFVGARRAALGRVPIRTHYVYGDYCIDFLFRAAQAGLAVVEFPYRCVERRAGESKTSPDHGRFARLGLAYARTIVRLRADPALRRNTP
jgi:dolichol-phosphate mannosyltransferase